MNQSVDESANGTKKKNEQWRACSRLGPAPTTKYRKPHEPSNRQRHLHIRAEVVSLPRYANGMQASQASSVEDSPNWTSGRQGPSFLPARTRNRAKSKDNGFNCSEIFT